MSEINYQRILDRFGAGRIADVSAIEQGVLARTTQGSFLVVDAGTDLHVARIELVNQEQRIRSAHPEAELLQLADYTGTATPESSYAHMWDRYYCVYKVEA